MNLLYGPSKAMHPLNFLSPVDASLVRSSFLLCAYQSGPSWGWRRGGLSSHVSCSVHHGWNMTIDVIIFTRCAIKQLSLLTELSKTMVYY